MLKTVQFQTIQFSISTQFKCQNSSISSNFLQHKYNLIVKIVLFQAIQFSTITQLSSIWFIDRTLSGATTPGQREPGSDGTEEVIHIPQSSSTAETSPSDCLVSYPGHSLGESYYPA